MAVLRVSLESVERLLVTQLATLAGGSDAIQYIERGQPDPDTDAGPGSTPWCRLLQVDCEDSVRNTAGPAYGDISGIVGLAVPGDLIIANCYALSRYLDVLAAALSYVRFVDTPETHDLTLTGCRKAQDVDPVIGDAADRPFATGGVLFFGKAVRTA